MPLFACTKCDTVDNTAVSDYWIQQKEHFELSGTREGFRALCSACRLGKWHGEFTRRTVQQAKMIEDAQGFLVDDPRDADATKMFAELIAVCCPSEQLRIISGCRDGYFGEPGSFQGPLDLKAPPARDPDAIEKKRETNG